METRGGGAFDAAGYRSRVVAKMEAVTRKSEFNGKCPRSGADRPAHDQSQPTIRKGMFEEVEGAVAHQLESNRKL